MYSHDYYTIHCKRLGSQNALQTLITSDLFLEGLKMTYKRVETCRPKIVFYAVNCCVLTDILYFECIRKTQRED